MKKPYEKAEIRITVFKSSEVIAASEESESTSYHVDDTTPNELPIL